MREYRFWEIGMLTGAAVGCILAVGGFALTDNSLSFVLAGIGIGAGIILGSMVDRSQGGNNKGDN